MYLVVLNSFFKCAKKEVLPMLVVIDRLHLLASSLVCYLVKIGNLVLNYNWSC